MLALISSMYVRPVLPRCCHKREDVEFIMVRMRISGDVEMLTRGVE